MPVRRTPATPSPSDAAALRLAQLAVAARGGAGGSASPGAGAEPTEDDWWADHTRIAVRPAADPPPAPTPPAALPLPGRHAARRTRVPRPPGLPGLPALGVAHLAVVALAVALGLALTTWWVVRDRSRPIDQVAPVAAQPTGAAAPVEPLVALPSGSSAGPGSGPGATVTSASVTVDVTGKVRRPGIVVLDLGARVTDALEAAGGPRRGVDLSSLNLARVLVDGEQVVVGGPAVAAAPGPGVPGAVPGLPGAGTGVLVNLNTAGQAELETLPQVGPVTAQAILAWRTEHGGFTRVDELLEVDGIGAKTLERLLPHVTV
ncbi:ComEA family DNA-binding protein [Pimelobacter simplex]|uniref:Competence protein n=1 Tax=Nocardioides simplex TaxID=2045 RepID=A0A0C5XBA1_NOCSI|nr:helix-hairpin-helix domain-containing protein [Pimelobacter simplex]AJR18550.1 Competence protein [Pimelobacter simplex]MCG8153756.1 ComEA family DNA-binding protein [Pimelobacter simplex]GEB15707.1 hypothetical protein NSI01_40220 [Pimelobacter simplex]SFN09633.1 competence protein ComEA [Pimelobacter simplex]